MSNVVLSGQYFHGGYPDDMRGRSLKLQNDNGALVDANALEMGVSASQAAVTVGQDGDHGTVLKLADGVIFVPAAGEMAKAGIG